MKRLVLALIVVFAVSACGGNELTSEFAGDEDAQRAELMRRPSAEEASARYLEMLGRIREGLTAEFPDLRWEQRDDQGSAGCAQFPAYRSEAETRTLGFWGALGNLPDAQWPRAQEIAGKIAQEYGFGPVRTIVNSPSNHEIVGFDGYGASYTMGTAKNTTLSGTTSCHLPQAVKDRIAATGQ